MTINNVNGRLEVRLTDPCNVADPPVAPGPTLFSTRSCHRKPVQSAVTRLTPGVAIFSTSRLLSRVLVWAQKYSLRPAVQPLVTRFLVRLSGGS
jgi:hypothetical protein